MKKLLYIILLFSLFAQAQNRYIYNFKVMRVVAKTNAEAEAMQQDAGITNASLYLTNNCRVGNTIISAIGYKNGKDWKVYEAPFDVTGRASAEFVGYSDDRNYAYFESRYWANGNGFEAETNEFYIIDLVNCTCAGFSKDEYQHSWEYPQDGNEDVAVNQVSSVKTQIVADGKRFTLMQSDFSVGELETDEVDGELIKQYGSYDNNSGIYEIQGQKLVKTFYYDEATLHMYPIQFAGNVAKGMVLRDIVDVYSPYSSNIELKEVPRFAYGDDTDEIGYELWFEEKLQYFLIVPDVYADVKRITGLTVISPEIEVSGLHTGMDVGAILKRFPDAKLNIDLINDWEYLYLKEPGLRLTFKTDEHTRIARYELNKKTGDYEAVKILDSKRKLDYISI